MENQQHFFKWQLTIGDDILIPFARGVYQIGVNCVNFDIDKPVTKSHILHVVINPPPSHPALWIDESAHGYSLASFVAYKKKTWMSPISNGDMSFCELDLRGSYKVRIDVIDENGVVVKGDGHCVLEMRLKHV